ncbi:hypothetical protein Pmani_034179 [Petrolisthes manimaculis]|uniref:Uncharacterized protein n=1 Tax=Petrolisthes manimaculis TaxID=1843537 RepID=A0AAE1NP61_9EUCA|nr:hypothetical protein Pmani_034179 [Petrolisthes manimaculis]
MDERRARWMRGDGVTEKRASSPHGHNNLLHEFPAWDETEEERDETEDEQTDGIEKGYHDRKGDRTATKQKRTEMGQRRNRQTYRRDRDGGKKGVNSDWGQ